VRVGGVLIGQSTGKGDSWSTVHGFGLDGVRSPVARPALCRHRHFARGRGPHSE
jgi:hypothetical protein